MKNNYFSTPILLITWKRPKETKKVINSLRKIKPKKLFISCDGPRKGNLEDIKKVKETREILINYINWDCDIKWHISKKNLGCRIGVTKAISWFFKNVEEGVILEDDIVAHHDFFNYCENLLEKYKNDKRIWCISGSNNQDGIKRGKGTYYFGKIPLIWGWATWKDRWESYDANLKKWPEIKKSKILKSIFPDQIEKEYWYKIWENYYSFRKPDTWDYAWVFTCVINNGLTAIPNKNLIENIGFNSEATHTKWERETLQPIHSIGKKIIHPDFFISDLNAEQYQFDFFFGGFTTRLKRYPLKRIKNFLKRTLKF